MDTQNPVTIPDNHPLNEQCLRVFIGYDPRQAISYNVLQHSIVTRASKPVHITPLIIQQLPITRQGLTPFTYSRYLVPWLCDYKGWALFMDADMLLLDDIAKLFAHARDEYGLMVVQNEQQFEWPSLMLFNCEKCTTLTPEYIEDKNNSMFDFSWTAPHPIGGLPPQWNHTVGYDPKREGMSLIHYTQGVPIFPEIQGCEYSDEWNQSCTEMISYESWQTLMGNSVHAADWNGQKIPKLKVQQLLDEAEKIKETLKDMDFMQQNQDKDGTSQA